MTFSSEFSYRDCPWCFTKNVAFVMLNSARVVTNSQSAHREWSWLVCPRCAGVVSVETQYGAPAILKTVPEKRENLDVEHLPADVEEYYQNAVTALNAGIPSSSAVELRRTLEAAAKHQGVEERTLVKAVQKLVELGLITKSFESVLSHVRKIGNQGAHATDEQLTETEVRSAMDFTTQVLRNLFEVPERLKLIQEPFDAESAS